VLLVGGRDERAPFLARQFAPAEIVALPPPGDDAAFQALATAIAARLAPGRLAVVDAPNLAHAERQPLVALARHFHAPPVALVLERGLDAEKLQRDGIALAYNVDAATALVREPLACNRHRDDQGPFDLIGDVHGCGAELETLLARLGWTCDAQGVVAHPQERRLVFVGDLTDRGPQIVAVLRTVLDAVAAGRAYWTPGNHDHKFARYLQGRGVQITHGLADTVAQIGALPPDERAALAERYLDAYAALPSHLVLAGGALVVAHAGIRAEMIGRQSPAIEGFVRYGATTGEQDAQGFPVRRDWSAGYDGEALVVYGHTPVARPRLVRNTLCIDQGAVFGGALTAFRWPERESVSVPAERVYYAQGHIAGAE
jgi:protein phosphatase